MKGITLKKQKKPTTEYYSNLVQFQKERKAIEAKKRKDDRGYSLEGLRLASLINQMQAFQAIQGLQELTPKEKGRRPRFTIPEDPKERARQREWLTFKADWLEALLEDTVRELEALDEYEGLAEVEAGIERRRYARKVIEIPAEYGVAGESKVIELRLCKVLNICLGGLKLVTDNQIGLNTDIEVVFEDGTNLSGMVMWSKKAEEEVIYFTGVMFKETFEVIENKIKRLKGE